MRTRSEEDLLDLEILDSMAGLFARLVAEGEALAKSFGIPVFVIKALHMLDVDPAGLDLMDRKLLSAVIDKFGGGPVGVDNLAAAIGEARDTIEDVLEPYLIQQGYLQRTLRGRIATPAIYRHLGLAEPASAVVRDLLDN